MLVASSDWRIPYISILSLSMQSIVLLHELLANAIRLPFVPIDNNQARSRGLMQEVDNAHTTILSRSKGMHNKIII